MKRLPTLYKKTSTGAIEQWTIRVELAPDDCAHCDQAYDIVTEHGQVGGKLIESRETVREGKNLGKKNATTALQQAESQAFSEWTVKNTRKGYVVDLERAKAGENDGAGGIRPMLAKEFAKHGKKLKFPCYAQPKLDGIRCIAIVTDTGVTLWSREQKPILAVPNIARAVEALGLPAGTVLDGELYNHELKDDFESIASCVRKQAEATPEDQALIQYHVYDLARYPTLPLKAHFGDRTTMLALILPEDHPVIKRVETRLCRTPGELEGYRQLKVADGYEGAMARALEEYQEGKRTADLLKMKVFLENDFQIVGVYRGKGKMADLAMFICSMDDGHAKLTPEETEVLVRRKFAGTKLFGCKLEGPLEALRHYLDDEALWWTKKLTVKYFTLTRKRRVCRFPVGKTVRDYE